MKKAPSPRGRGRPRRFDRNTMLHQALMLFWKHGYEGTSVAQLVEAMGVKPPSLYAAFGSKEALYREAVALYLKGPGQFVARALTEEPTARQAVARSLRDAARTFTDRAHPAGCVVATGVLGCATAHQDVANGIAALRQASIDATAARLQLAKKQGELPAEVDARALARFYGAVIQGMSVQAKDGATTKDLLAIADAALAAWPGQGPAPLPASPR